jgi:biopolymer transport protein ExbD
LTAVGQALDYWPHDNKHLEERVKSRIMVWSLVGIVAIIGVIVIATAPKTARGPEVTLDMVKSEAAKAETRLDRLVVRLDARRKTMARAAATNEFDEADRLLAEAREKLGQARQATDVKQARQLLIEGRQALRKARRAVTLATKPARRPSGL